MELARAARRHDTRPRRGGEPNESLPERLSRPGAWARVRALLIATTAFATTVVVGAAIPRASRADEGPRAVVEATTSAVIKVLADKSLSTEEKRHRVEEIVYARVDFDTLSRLVLARHWNQLNDAQRGEFAREFKQNLSATYGRNVESYKNERVTIIDDREEARGDWTVRTKIVRNGPNDISVDYRLRKTGDTWKIIDVIIEGVSLVSNYRSQFQDIMSSGGIERLLKLLHEKNERGEPIKEPPPTKK